MLEKRGLSYARLTMDDDGATLSVSGRRQQGLENLAFIGPAKQSFWFQRGPIAAHRALLAGNYEVGSGAPSS
jgi:hypothetical protein